MSSLDKLEKSEQTCWGEGALEEGGVPKVGEDLNVPREEEEQEFHPPYDHGAARLVKTLSLNCLEFSKNQWKNKPVLILPLFFTIKNAPEKHFLGSIRVCIYFMGERG